MPKWSLQIGSRHHNRGSSSVISDWKPLPVWHQSVFFSSEHDSNIGGVVDGGVEVSVVSNLSRQVHGGIGLSNEGALSKKIVLVLLLFEFFYSYLRVASSLQIPQLSLSNCWILVRASNQAGRGSAIKALRVVCLKTS